MFLFNKKVSNERQKQLSTFQKRLGLRFKNLSLLDRAFIHRSSVKNHNDSNERLEFLGDSVLGLVVATSAFKNYPEYTEGKLARIKAATVSEESLVSVANDLRVADYLVLGKGELMSGGREKKAILADTVEAIIGAIYLDSGFKTAEAFVLKAIQKQLDLVIKHRGYEDFKSVLQEASWRKFNSLPKYVLEKTEGPDHNLTFWVSLEVGGKHFGPCSGKSKKEAEQLVAELACKKLGV